jgi:hypothetical protein
MATNRPDIRMTGAEVAEFLSTQARVVVVAVAQGQPIATVGSAKLIGEAWWVTLDAKDPVAQTLAVDDRVCVLVDQFPTYYEIKGVAAHGRARKQTDARGGFTFTLPLDDVTSFDFGKIPVKGDAHG